MRVSAKVDYALRAIAQLAADGGGRPVKAEQIAKAQDIPPSFLHGILRELKRARLVKSYRGTEGGFGLARLPELITLAEVMRVIDGPLVNLRDSQLRDLEYLGPTLALEDVWMAVRASVRSVLENVTVANLISGSLPPSVRGLADEYRQTELLRPGEPWSSVTGERQVRAGRPIHAHPQA
jgi:Rrf2 family protein